MDFFTVKPPKKIPLKPYTDFSVIYYIKWSVVAIFSVNPMHSVKPMSVKVMHHCIVKIGCAACKVWYCARKSR